jgi:acetyltransferase-like isoleucine patch superfamily enzyme
MASSVQPHASGVDVWRNSIQRVARYTNHEWQSIHWRLNVAQLLVSGIPHGTAGNVRTSIYRRAGFKHIGAKVYIRGTLDLRGAGDIYDRLHLGHGCSINTPCLLDLSADIVIGEGVNIGHNTMIITSTHEMGSTLGRCGPVAAQPVRIGDGAWIGAGVLIMPGVTIGEGAVIVAGAMVSHDVPANAKVAGNPARVIARLD